jgi:hypothetical protein
MEFAICAVQLLESVAPIYRTGRTLEETMSDGPATRLEPDA